MIMNVIEKNLKLSCIACLFVGLAAIVVGVIVDIQTIFDSDAIATVLCGIGSMPAGAQSSRLANVPSNAYKVRSISIIVLLFTIAIGAFAVMTGNPTPVQIGVIALVCIAALCMLIYSQKLVKQLERV